MPAFRSPTPRLRINATTEKRALNAHFRLRDVPTSTPGRLLLASWNVANLGDQDRNVASREIIAHMLRRFDLIAVQEIKDKYKAFADIVSRMGSSFDFVMSDTAGNRERLAFVYRRGKVSPRQLFGELALRDREFPKRTVKVRYRQGGRDRVDTFRDVRFRPFDRNPFIGSFACESFDLTVVNTHLYFGKFGNSTKKEDRAKYARRVLEVYALSRWADRASERDATYDKDIVLVGDMNIPAMTPEDSAYGALTAFGWHALRHGTRTGSMTNIRNTKTYDQVVFAPGPAKRRIVASGVFDFDNAVFRSKWDQLIASNSLRKAEGIFRRYAQYHLSDHRPVWVQLRVT